MNSREKILLGLTIAAIAIYLLFSVGGVGETVDEWLSAGEELENLEAEFQRNSERIADAKDIYKEYYQIVGPGSGRPKDSEDELTFPDLEFQKDVAYWCETVGFRQPNLSKSIQEIEGVDDYRLIVVEVSLRDAEKPRTANLMKLFHRNGLIIREVNLAIIGEGDRITAQIAVARVTETALLGAAGQARSYR